MNDEQLKQIADALSSASYAADDFAEKLKVNAGLQDVMTLQAKESNDAIDKEILARLKSDAALTRGERVYEQQMRSLGLVKNALGEFEQATVSLTATQKQRLAEEQVISNRQKTRDDMSAKAHAMMADKTGTLITGLTAFGGALNKTIFDSTKGQGKYGELLGSAGDKVQSLGNLFGPFGKAISFALGGLIKLGGAALQQQETLNKAYETLSEFGAVDVSGIDGMFKNLQSMGMTVGEIGKFGEILKTAGPNLAMMGTTAADGAKKFADTMAVVKNSGAERQLRMLGFTTESMAKTFVDYQGLMSRQGFIQGKSTAQVAKESVEYAKTLDQLAKLTGHTRDEMQKRMDADANDMKFRLKIQEMEAAGDKAGADRLRKASVLVADFGEDTASGFREMVANNGAVVGEASSKLLISTGGAAKQIVEDLNAGKISHLEAAKLIATAKEEQVNRFRAVGKLDNEIMSQLGLSVKDMDAINKYKDKTNEDLKQIDKDQEAQAKGAVDKQRAAEVQRQITERNMEQGKDRLTNMVGKLMVGAFESLLKMVNAVGKGLAEFVKFITFGEVDMTDLFASADTIAEDLKKTSGELGKTNKQIEDINNAKARYDQKQAEYLKKNQEIDELEIQLSKETNSEKKKELEATLTQSRKSRAELKAETDLAKTDMQKRGQLPKLQAEKERLEKQQSEQKTKLQEKTGTTGEEKESPEVKKIRSDQEKLLKERADLAEVIEDKAQLLRKETLAQLAKSNGFTEKDLEDKEKLKVFEKAYAENKKKYIERTTQIDSSLEKSEKDLAILKKKEVDAATSSKGSKPAGAAGAPAGGAPSAGAEGATPESEQQRGLNPKSSAGSDKALEFGDKSGSKSNFEGLNASIKERVSSAAEEYNSITGKKIKVNSAKRDPADQERVYQETVDAGRPGIGPTGMQVAKPGRSKHEQGAAIDIQNYRDPAAIAAMNKQGLYQTVPNDPVHFEIPKASLGGLFTGPESGYPVLLHGNEAVIPMPNVGGLAGLESVNKTPLPGANSSSSTVAVGENSASMMDQFMTLQTDLMNMLSSKLDALDSRLAKGNDIQSDILTYSS